MGAVGEDLPLKQRLERLVAAASRGRGASEAVSPEGPVRGLEEIVQGCRVENQRGEFFLIEDALPLETFHGDVCLSRFRSLEPEAVRILAGEPGFDGFDLREAVFLDTETTGLAGGTGTAAFLIGVGYVDDDRFRLKQYFMRDYHEEAALLRALGEDLSGFSRVVTYNGRMFDLPLLEARCRLNRERFPLAEAVHLDLLHPARRLWKARLESCQLAHLESALLGVQRGGDIPGSQIPGLYFDYVRRRDARAMAAVFKHNRIDVLSLAALTVHACQWVQLGWAEDARDVYSVARVLERAALHERSDAEYRRAIQAGAGTLQVAALLRLAARMKRAGDHVEAAELWRVAANAGSHEALRELSIHHEHRTRDWPAALGLVEEALNRLTGEGHPTPRRLAKDLSRRRERLLGKLARRPDPPPQGG